MAISNCSRTSKLCFYEFVLFLVALANAAEAQEMQSYYWTHEHPVNNSKPDSKQWRDLIGKQVQVEGIAWGSFEKGHGEYIILDNARVYIEDANFSEKDMDGKPVRAIGKLSVLSDASDGTLGKAIVIGFILENCKTEKLDRVTWPWICYTNVEQKK